MNALTFADWLFIYVFSALAAVLRFVALGAYHLWHVVKWLLIAVVTVIAVLAALAAGLELVGIK